jgi:hypothetical protein
MLLSIVEMEQKLADQQRDHLLEEDVPTDEEEQASLAYEQAYSQGFATGVSSIRKLVEEAVQ